MTDEFWARFHDQVNACAHKEIWRSRMEAYSAVAEWPQGMSGIKFMSYFGAIAVDEFSLPGVPLEKLCFKCPIDGSFYMDPGNWVYKRAFRFIWPRALPGFSNQETIGDVVEAFLGFAYIQNVYRPGWWGAEQRELVRLLELVITNVYLHWSFFVEEISWTD